MQPETQTKDQIKFGVDTEKHKENLASPATQWDHLAFSVIGNELVPKGFKEIRSGVYRGAVQANIPYLDKKTVIKTQKIAAQLVRGFRDKTKQRIAAIIKEVDQWIAEDEVELKECGLLQFKKKRNLKDKLISLRGQAGSYHRLLQELENVSIK